MKEIDFGPNLALAVRIARESLGWSVRALALRAEIYPSTVFVIESNKREVSIKTAKKVAKAFGITLEALIGLAKKLEEENLKLLSIESKMQDLAKQALKL